MREAVGMKTVEETAGMVVRAADEREEAAGGAETAGAGARRDREAPRDARVRKVREAPRDFRDLMARQDQWGQWDLLDR